MITSFRTAGALLLSGAGLAACAPSGEQGTDAAALAAITADGLMAHTRVLASDAFEGRGPGTAGEDSTVRYLTDTFKAMGLAPGNPNGSYEQAVEMVGFTVHPTVSIRVGGKTMRLAAPADISVGSLRAVEKVVAQSPIPRPNLRLSVSG